MLHVRVNLLCWVRTMSSKTILGLECSYLFRCGTLEDNQGFEACGSVTAEESMQLCKFTLVCYAICIIIKLGITSYINKIDVFLSMSIT